jgi:hypothetical protein
VAVELRDKGGLHMMLKNGARVPRKAANLMRGRLIGSLPVVDCDRLFDLVTVTDLLALPGPWGERPGGETRAVLHHGLPLGKATTSGGRS